jgi:hypothetical protein
MRPASQSKITNSMYFQVVQFCQLMPRTFNCRSLTFLVCGVLLWSAPFKIAAIVVLWVAIKVPTFHATWAWSDKGFEYKAMSKNMTPLSANAKQGSVVSLGHDVAGKDANHATWHWLSEAISLAQYSAVVSDEISRPSVDGPCVRNLRKTDAVHNAPFSM